ncbi:ABC transporter ATP-binding protein, partial [Streptomyces niveus]
LPDLGHPVLQQIADPAAATAIGILMITHDLGVARLVSDRIHVMRGGRFIESGPVEQVVDAPREQYTRDLLATVPVLGPWDETPPALPADEKAVR